MSAAVNSAPPVGTARERSLLGRTFDYLAKAVLIAAGASLVGMACVEGWQVFARYVLNRSPSWTEPVALMLMSTTMMLGASLGVRARRHFGFFMLIEHSRPAIRRVLQAFAQLVAALMGLLLAGWGGEMVLDSWSYSAPGTPFPQGVAYLPLCIGGALIALFSFEQLFAPESRS